MAKKTKEEAPDVVIKPKDALAKFIKDTQKKHGDKLDIGFGDEIDLDYGFLTPPIPAIAQLLGRDDGTPGGFPKGKITVIAGPERSGKTTLVLQTIADDMRKNPDQVYVWLDTENSFDQLYAVKLGIDMSRLLIIKNGNMQDVLNRIIDLAEMGQYISAFIVDSIGGLTPKEELEDSKGNKHGLEKDHMLNLQRKLPQFLRMVNAAVGKHKIPIILISHVYTDVGGYGGFVVKGGNGLKHWGHVRLMISRANDHGTKRTIVMPDGNKKEVFTGHDVIVLLQKTRQNSKENQSVIVPYRYGIGLDAVESTISVAINLGIIERSGAWYNYGENKMQGRKGVTDFFGSDNESYQQIINDIAVYYEMNKEEIEAPTQTEENIDESIA